MATEGDIAPVGAHTGEGQAGAHVVGVLADGLLAVIDVDLQLILGQGLETRVDLALYLGAQADELVGALLVAVFVLDVTIGIQLLLLTEELAGVDAAIEIEQSGVIFIDFDGLSLEGGGESQCYYCQLFHHDPLCCKLLF